MALAQSLPAIASFASPYRRCADQPMVSSSSDIPAHPARRAKSRAASKLVRMKKNYSAAADWDASFVAPMHAEVPRELSGLRLDQALARVFPQYSRSRLQDWLAAGHIRIDGRAREARSLVVGGEKIDLQPP